MIRAFAAMFLEEPHRTTRNYARIAEQVGTQIFAEGHRLEPYYVAGLALYKLEYFFRNQRLDAKYKPARHYILLGVRLLSGAAGVPRFNSNEMERYCNVIREKLWDADQTDQIFTEVVDIIDEIAQGNFDRDNIRTEEFTKQVVSRCRARRT